jgi:protein-tyrosine phosphatase
MREAVSGRLWLGNSGDLGNTANVLQAGIQAVIDLAVEQLMPSFPRTIMYCHFPVMDGQQELPAALQAAIETVAIMLRARIPTLVCCSAGMSRSPAVAAAALSIAAGGTPDDRLREIVRGQPHDVSPGLWDEVHKAVRQIREEKVP